jgi:signal transduction histidine kinase
LELLLVVSSYDQLLVPIIFSDLRTIQKKEESENSIFLIYLGILLAMFIYNVIIYFTVRDNVYLYYIFYISTVGITQFVLYGFIQSWFPPEIEIKSILISLIPALSGVATILFTQNFIRTKEFVPIIHKVLNVFLSLYLVAIVFSFFGKHFYVQLILNLGAASALILIFASMKAIRSGFRPARFFLLSWCLFIVGLMVYALRNFGLLPFNTFTNFALPVGSVIEILLLSFALADRINVLKQEKEISQQLAFTTMQENERLVKEQNSYLENKVHERTLDLENRNSELNQALADLKTTQQQLVESEKLASLGQMTAGIAHEINNPINFVQSNVGPLKRDVQDILSLLEQYANLENDSDLQLKLNNLKAQYKNLEIDFLKEEISQLLNGIEEGSKRTAEIVKGLRIFSRMDKNERVMKNMTKAEVTLNIHLAKDLPKIDCYPGKLSQVFMNLITNAVQATKLPNRQPKDRIITIESVQQNEYILIHISDNGAGIPDQIHDKIFEPFFTTKDVGEGTGLGLSIVHGIVAEHNGTIDFQNVPEGGTRFTIHLPITNQLHG